MLCIHTPLKMHRWPELPWLHISNQKGGSPDVTRHMDSSAYEEISLLNPDLLPQRSVEWSSACWACGEWCAVMGAEFTSSAGFAKISVTTHEGVLRTVQAVTLYRNSCLPKKRHAGAGNSFHTLVQLAKFVLSAHSTGCPFCTAPAWEQPAPLQPFCLFCFLCHLFIIFLVHLHLYYFDCKLCACCGCEFKKLGVKTLRTVFNIHIECQLVWWNIVVLSTRCLLLLTLLSLMLISERIFFLSLCRSNK